MKLICLEEHVLDPATAKASMPAALKAAPFLPGWGSTVTDGRNPDHSRPQVIANADSTRKGMDWEQERLADMDAAGVDMQVLSLGGFPQFAPPEQELPLAEQGYITIAFDAAYQGGSSGTPRYTDKPQNRIEDIRAAADFITQYAGADASRLGLLGVCGGGGYSIKAAQTDKRFRSIATISMFNTGDARRNGYMRSQKDSIQERLAKAAEARALEARTGEVQYTPEFGAGMTSEQVAAIKVDLYRQGYEYYVDTHYHPNSKTNSTVSSLADLMEFDVNTNVDLINQPLLMIAGEKADSLYMTEEVFANATGTDNKELFRVPGATHIETYWKPEYVKQISEKLTDFFGRNL